MSVLPDFDDELFVGGRMKIKISRSEKRARRQEYQKKDGTEAVMERHCLDLSAEELKVLQDEDSTLTEVKKAADSYSYTAGSSFFRKMLEAQECLAIKLGDQACKVYLPGRRFHFPTWLNRLKKKSARLSRANGNADALSRAGAA